MKTEFLGTWCQANTRGMKWRSFVSFGSKKGPNMIINETPRTFPLSVRTAHQSWGKKTEKPVNGPPRAPTSKKPRLTDEPARPWITKFVDVPMIVQRPCLEINAFCILPLNILTSQNDWKAHGHQQLRHWYLGANGKHFKHRNHHSNDGSVVCPGERNPNQKQTAFASPYHTAQTKHETPQFLLSFPHWIRKRMQEELAEERFWDLLACEARSWRPSPKVSPFPKQPQSVK